MAKAEVPAQPVAALGDVVAYIDRNGREQEGEIICIEANWRKGHPPSIGYTVRHPTYRNGMFHTTADSFVKVLP
ncbi:hypothetical protein SAMN04488498_104355 [Mesorhizobium albiziae]|uniref:Uncharacterized protein n=1 Tax=Neomesorhizobium albiziae TaxID=335020 RepID=A0A1I3YCP1_9HYPH|nr:hypothetical protein [Mesorhizobium albiziae]GLS29939.1 hypothetical protein GCM10007937_16470 [Mesorhizobium albiziae]SFK29707.1 hypothetical protein SAMN04488498_104355 [Mesorhizobium albiziae]